MKRPSALMIARLRAADREAAPAPWKTVRNNHAQIWPGEGGSSRIVWSVPLSVDVLYVPPFRGKEQSNVDALVAVEARNALPLFLAERDELLALLGKAIAFISRATHGAPLAGEIAAALEERGE